jgi:hypothetical protein
VPKSVDRLRNGPDRWRDRNLFLDAAQVAESSPVVRAEAYPAATKVLKDVA